MNFYIKFRKILDESEKIILYIYFIYIFKSYTLKIICSVENLNHCKLLELVKVTNYHFTRELFSLVREFSRFEISPEPSF